MSGGFARGIGILVALLVTVVYQPTTAAAASVSPAPTMPNLWGSAPHVLAGPTESALQTLDSVLAPAVTLTIRTEPVLAGVRLSLDGDTYTTDINGTAVVTRPHDVDPHVLSLVDIEIQAADQRYTFVRWSGQRSPDDAFDPIMDLAGLRADAALTAAYEVHQQVTPTFVDQQGNPIPPDRISSATARSDTGVMVKMPTTGTIWLSRTRVLWRANAVELKDVSYSWQSVIVHGANVVDSGRQTFTPAVDGNPNVVGEFYQLTVIGYDAMLRWGAGTDVTVTLPDGSERHAPMSDAHTAVFRSLPRGNYSVTVAASASIVADHLVRLSADTVLDVPVIGPTDVSLLVALVLVFAAGSVLVGRKNVRQRISRALHRTGVRTART